MRLRPQIVWNREGAQPGFLFDPRTGGIYALNRTAAAILEQLAAGHDCEALTAHLVRTFEVQYLAARDDVESFVAELRENDLVEL